jgi:hypothetical protein
MATTSADPEPRESPVPGQDVSDQPTARLFGVWKWIIARSDWRARGFIIAGALCAALFAAGTASLSFIVTIDSKHASLVHHLGLSREAVVLLLTGLFLLRPLSLTGHVRCISASLRDIPRADRPVAITLLHRVLAVTSRDLPLLAMLAAALVIQNGLIALLALLIVPVGPMVASFLIHRHTRLLPGDLDADEIYIRKRNALARSEALSDFPQTVIMAGMILWYTSHAQSLAHGPVAAVVINVMLASPPLRRLTKLASDVVARQKHDEED